MTASIGWMTVWLCLYGAWAGFRQAGWLVDSMAFGLLGAFGGSVLTMLLLNADDPSQDIIASQGELIVRLSREIETQRKSSESLRGQLECLHALLDGRVDDLPPPSPEQDNRVRGRVVILSPLDIPPPPV